MTGGYTMKEKNIRELAIRMGLITVEDMCQYTITQLVVKIANKVNELVNEVWRFETDVQEILKSQNENIQYLLGEGLHLEVENIFDGWLQDGTFDTLINQTALEKVNERIDETNAQLSQDKKELLAKIQEVAETGTTTEVLQDTTKKYIDEKIVDGTIANLTIEDNSITKNKLENELVADVIDTYSQPSNIDALFTEDYVASSNHSSQSEGTIVSSPAYQLSEIICLKKGNKISFTANTSKSVCTLSKFTKDGEFIKSIFIGNEDTVKYSYTVEDEYEFLRVCSKTGKPITDLTVISATSSNREMIQDEITKINQIINFENADVEIDVALNSGYIASSNHTSGEGTINISESYVYSDIFTIKKGETIGIKATTSPNAIVLAEYDSSNNFIKGIIVGDEVTNYYEYTATKDIEYLRVCSKVGVDLIISKVNKNLILDKINKAILSSTTTSPNSIRKPVINFIFDDGVLTNDEIFYSVFKSKGLVCGFALPTNINTTRFQSYLEFQANGFEILSHSTDGSAMSDGAEDVEVIEEKMKSSKEFLEQKGFEITGWVTPSSTLNDKYLTVLRKYYEYAYTVYLGTWKPNLEQYPYNVFKEDTCKLKRVSLEGSTTENVLLAIDEVCTNGGILSFYAHGYRGNLTEESLTQILDYVNKKVDNNECLVMSPTNCYKHYFTLRHNDLIGLI